MYCTLIEHDTLYWPALTPMKPTISTYLSMSWIFPRSLHENQTLNQLEYIMYERLKMNTRFILSFFFCLHWFSAVLYNNFMSTAILRIPKFIVSKIETYWTWLEQPAERKRTDEKPCISLRIGFNSDFWFRSNYYIWFCYRTLFRVKRSLVSLFNSLTSEVMLILPFFPWSSFGWNIFVIWTVWTMHCQRVSIYRLSMDFVLIFVTKSIQFSLIKSDQMFNSQTESIHLIKHNTNRNYSYFVKWLCADFRNEVFAQIPHHQADNAIRLHQ